MDMQDLIRIMVQRYQREASNDGQRYQREASNDGQRALLALAESFGIYDAFMEALELAWLDS